ncbi:MAG TPA: protein kinase, partial [Rhodothermia bacterium]|nr:protein kinase [Rhodothermia bacterium]
GTVAYMSPEQAGGREADARSDLWAVGVLMYEMLTGSRPFRGDYDQAVIYGILNEEPIPLARLNQDIPPAVSDVVSKLLAKDPADRFQTAGALAAALSTPAPPAGVQGPERPAFLLGKSAWVGVAVVLIAAVAFLIIGLPTSRHGEEVAIAPESTASHRATLAVLPFSNLRRDPETDFLGYALADQVIGSLTYVENLTVRPASSVRQYQDGDYDVQQAGISLGADYVMAGNYLQQGDQMRLTVELVDVGSREMIWREPIELEYRDVFGMQDIVAERLLKRLEVQFSEVERSRMRADVSADPVAYEYYLRALSHPEDREGNLLAVSLLEKAVSLDSTFAPAWDNLGVRLRTQGYWDLGGREVTFRAKACFERALELNPDLVSALSHVSLFYAEIGELDRAYASAQRVLEINPNNAEGHFARGYVLRYAGLVDESAEEMRRAIASDSTNPIFRSAGFTFRSTRDYDDALSAYALGSVAGLKEGWEAVFLRQDGQIEAADSLMAKAARYDPDGVLGLWARSVLSSWKGDYAAGVAAAAQWESAELLDAEGIYFIASAYCANQDYARCLSLLAKSFEGGYYNYRLWTIDSFLDGAREMPEFRALLERVKRESEAFRERHGLNDKR